MEIVSSIVEDSVKALAKFMNLVAESVRAPVSVSVLVSVAALDARSDNIGDSATVLVSAAAL